MAISTDDRPDWTPPEILEQVHQQAVRTPISEVAESLQRLLTGRLVAYIAGVKDAKTVGALGHGRDRRGSPGERAPLAHCL